MKKSMMIGMVASTAAGCAMTAYIMNNKKLSKKIEKTYNKAMNDVQDAAQMVKDRAKNMGK